MKNSIINLTPKEISSIHGGAESETYKRQLGELASGLFGVTVFLGCCFLIVKIINKCRERRT